MANRGRGKRRTRSGKPTKSSKLRCILNRVKPIFKKLAGFGLLLWAIAMIQIAEYALAVLLLILSAIAFCFQIHEWKGFRKRLMVTKAVKIASFAGIVFVLGCSVVIALKIKGIKPWSNLLSQEQQPQVAIQEALNSFKILYVSDENDRPIPAPSNKRRCFNRSIQAFSVDIHYTAESGPDIEGITVKLERVEHDGKPDVRALWGVVLQQAHEGGKDTQENLKQEFELKAGGKRAIAVISSHPWYPEASYIYHTDPNADKKLPPGRCTLYLGVWVKGKRVAARVFETTYDPETRHLAFWPQDEEQPETPEFSVKLPKLTIGVLPQNQEIMPGKMFGGDCRWINVGPGKLFNAICYSRAYVLDVGNDRTDIYKTGDMAGHKLAEELGILGKQYCEGDKKGKEIAVGESLPFKAFTRTLTRSDVDKIIEGKKIVYVVSWLVWEDSKGNKDSAHDCRWLQYPYRSADDWHPCMN